MQENEKEKEHEQEQEQEQDYVEAIKKLKAESVSKEAYNKLQEENKKLFDALVDGGQVEAPKKEEEIDVKEIHKKLSERDPRMTNLEGFQAMLDLRKADLAAGKIDPFISMNNKTPTQEDFDRAEERAKIYQECIDYADGDAELFSQELQRRMIDTQPIKK